MLKKKGEGEINYLPRINDNKTRLKILFNDVLVKDYATIYVRYLEEGRKCLLSKIEGNAASKVNREDLGWYREECTDIVISKKELKDIMSNREEISIIEKNRQYFCDLIEECQKMNIDVILLVLPISESRIFKYNNFDEWSNTYKLIAQKYNCVFIDMNLLVNRNEFISESNSFFNEYHLGIRGATESTMEFSKIYNKICNGEDVSDMFYPSYDEAIKHLEYYEIYQSMLKE